MDKEDLRNLPADKIIEGHIAFAMKLAKPFCAGFNYYADDIRGAARLGLCEGVCAAIKADKRDYIPQYIYLYVRQHILESLASLSLVPIPRSFIKKMRMQAYEKGESFSYKELQSIVLSTTGEDFIYDIGRNDFYWFEIFDIFKFLELTEFESSVVLRRIFKFRLTEIAEEFKCTKQWISLTLKEIGRKYERKTNFYRRRKKREQQKGYPRKMERRPRP